MPANRPMGTLVPTSKRLQGTCKNENQATGMQGGFDFSTPAARIEELYAVVREAVAEWGGEDALAADMDISRQLINVRLRRSQDTHGNLQRLHLDVLGHLACDPAVRRLIIDRLCSAWGFKSPEPLNEPSDSEKLRTLLASLDGDAGEAILERAAKRGGFDRASFRRGR